MQNKRKCVKPAALKRVITVGSAASQYNELKQVNLKSFYPLTIIRYIIEFIHVCVRNMAHVII